MNSFNWNPSALLQVSGSYWYACTLHAGVKLDVFTSLARSPETAEQLSRKLSVDTRGLRMLLDALTAMALLDKRDDRYFAAEAAASFLNRESDRYIGHMILHHHHLLPSWGQLDLSVKSGKPVRSRGGVDADRRREAFLLGMYNMASQQAPQIASQIDLSGRRRLLDLGGGPGTYAIHFCRNNPQLHAVVFDLPTTRSFAQPIIDKHGFGERIRFMEGDFLVDKLPGRFDAVWMSHILHAEGPEVCRKLIQSAVRALDRGGLLIIHDFILTDTMDGPVFPALFALNMLLGTEQGRTYSESQIRNMMQQAGIGQIERLAYQGPTESGILLGVVSA
jgi:SAM-dependent methyltransferase